MPLNHRAKLVAVKVEGTKGTAETLTASEADLLVYDPEMQADVEFEQRAPANVGSGHLGSVQGQHMGSFRCRVEARGEGTAATLPSWADTLLLACGLENTSAVLTPTSDIDSQTTVTIGLWEDGKKKVLYGAMGNCVITGEVGKRVFFEFEFKGIFSAVTDVANLSGITYETTAPLRLASTTFTINSVAQKLSRFRLDLGVDVQLRDDPATAAALSHAYIAGQRNPTLNLDPEGRLVADEDVWGAFFAESQVAVAINLGSVDGNKINIAAAKFQRTQQQSQERKGLQVYDVTGELASTTAGDDAYSITFPAAA